MEKTAFQTFSTTPNRDRSRRGFTLVEVMVAATISSIILAGVISTFLLMGRTGMSLMNYTEIEAQARKALEMFSREVHNANNVTAKSPTSVTITIPDKSIDPDGTLANGTALAGAYTVTYTFANNKLTRTGPPIEDPTAASVAVDLVTGVQPISGTDYLNYYKYVRSTVIGLGYVNGFTTNVADIIAEVRQIEVSFALQRNNVTVAGSTNKVLSARFILRNK
jgi:prepilin-type N-terminal cleavage/methylation domain-containing protein